MNSVDFLAEEVYRRYGAVTRARGCFLYTAKNVRLVDMYQEGGRAILGWHTPSFTLFKNVLNRGLVGSFDTVFSARLETAVSSLLDSPRNVLVFSGRMEAMKAALSFSKGGTSWWKPWGFADVQTLQKTDCVLIEPPLAWTQNVFLLAVAREVFEVHKAVGVQPPDCIRLPAPLLAAITRAIYDIIAEIPNRSEKDWFAYDKILCKYWERRGPYLFPKVSENAYGDFVQHCLDCEIVISPDFNTPSIVPFGVNFGVFDKLKRLPFSAD